MESSSSLWTVSFWKDSTERAIKTAAQSIALVFTGGAFNVLEDLDVKTVLGAALTGALYSLVTSIGSDILPFGTKGTASLTKAVQPADASQTETGA